MSEFKKGHKVRVIDDEHTNHNYVTKGDIGEYRGQDTGNHCIVEFERLYSREGEEPSQVIIIQFFEPQRLELVE